MGEQGIEEVSHFEVQAEQNCPEQQLQGPLKLYTIFHSAKYAKVGHTVYFQMFSPPVFSNDIDEIHKDFLYEAKTV